MKSSLTENSFHNCFKSSGNYSFLKDFGTRLGLADAVDVTGEVEHLVGEAPLIVVPCDELHEVIVQGENLLFSALLSFKKFQNITETIE